MENTEDMETAFQEFIQQTEKAKSEGWIYSVEYEKILKKARQKAFSEPPEKLTYSDGGIYGYVIGSN